jgi:hypothetical protein
MWDYLVRLYATLGSEMISIGTLRGLVQVVGMLDTIKMEYGIPRRGFYSMGSIGNKITLCGMSTCNIEAIGMCDNKNQFERCALLMLGFLGFIGTTRSNSGCTPLLGFPICSLESINNVR